MFFTLVRAIARAPGGDFISGGVEQFSVIGGCFSEDEDGVVTPCDVCFPAKTFLVMTTKPNVLVCDVEFGGQVIECASLCDIGEFHFDFDVVVPFWHIVRFLSLSLCCRAASRPGVVITPLVEVVGRGSWHSEGLRDFCFVMSAIALAVGKKNPVKTEAEPSRSYLCEVMTMAGRKNGCQLELGVFGGSGIGFVTPEA